MPFVKGKFLEESSLSYDLLYILLIFLPVSVLYFFSFKKLLTFLEDGITSQDNPPRELQSESCFDGEIPMTMCCNDDKVYCIIKDMVDSSVGLTSSVALKKYRIIGEQLYHKACELYSKISTFEANIPRYYFDVLPLDANQLQNWHDYLDFIELQGDFDWAVKLYERCLIVCANYPDYWMRYADFMEAKGGREIANYSLDRATGIYLKSVPAIHLFNARFKEQIGDVLAARAAYIRRCKEIDSDFVENVISKANMEKRLGNTELAFSIYKEALEIAATEEKLQALPMLYVHFSRLKYMSTNNVDAARVVLTDGIRTLPQNKLLLEELIKFSMMHGGKKHMDVIDSIIAGALSPKSDISQGLSAEDAEDISNLYLEFVDYCGTINDVRKALNRHIRLFPDSARINSCQHSTKSRRPLNLIKNKREETSVAMSDEAPRDPSSNLQAHLPQQNKKMSSEKYCDTQSDDANDGLVLMENNTTQPNDTDPACLQITESDDKAEDNARELPISVSEEPRDNDSEQHFPSADLVGVKEESTKFENLKKDCSGSDISSENLLHPTASGNQPSQALQASSNENSVFPQGKCELETEELKPLSVTSESLNPQESTRPDSGLTASQVECETIPESCKSNTANWYNSSRSTQVSDYAQTHDERNRPNHLVHRTKRPFFPSRLSRNSGGNWGPNRNTGKFRGGSKYGNRERGGPNYGNREYTHRKEHQHRHLSLQQMHTGDGGAYFPEVPVSSQSALQVQQCNQGQNQFQATAPTADFVAAQSWPIQNIQTQNSLSQSQLQASTTSNVSQHSMQDNDQYGYMQNGQDHNQMWHHYYYQQQQLQLQQHYSQLQQQSFQPELLQQLKQQSFQPELSQQLQQQSFKPELSQQLQQQSQPEPLQPQQLQQLHFQIQQVLQQQQPQQSVYLQQLQPSTQSSSNPAEDQMQALVIPQGQEAMSSQQSGDPGLISSSVLNHPQEKPTQEE